MYTYLIFFVFIFLNSKFNRTGGDIIYKIIKSYRYRGGRVRYRAIDVGHLRGIRLCDAAVGPMGYP